MPAPPGGPVAIEPAITLQELAAELKRLRAEVEQLKKEKVSWSQEIISLPEDKRGCRNEREYQDNAIRPAPEGPLTLTRCAHCGMAMTTTIVVQEPSRQRYPTIPLCTPCGAQHKRLQEIMRPR